MDYTGIGARDTPHVIMQSMTQVANYLAEQGVTLRSGGASGADTAFEIGCDISKGKKKIYLPYKGFNKNPSLLFGSLRDSRMLAKQFHPAWDGLGSQGREFMARNCHQVLSETLSDPSEFILCWTHDGTIRGGTGQALRMAAHYKIPVYNFATMSLDDISTNVMRHLE